MEGGQRTFSLFVSFIFLLLGFSSAQKTITAESGQNVDLTCRAPNINICVKWSRADLEPEYVLLYRDDLFVPDNQHPSFKDRVDLQDRQMKDGDVSLILNNVTINDTGTYKCRVIQRKTRSWKSISITLSVVDPPAPPGGAKDDGDGVRRFDGLVAFGLLLLVCAVAAAVMISKKQKDPPLHHPPEEEKNEMV